MHVGYNPPDNNSIKYGQAAMLRDEEIIPIAYSEHHQINGSGCDCVFEHLDWRICQSGWKSE